MRVGTRSLLFGSHCWFVHPVFVFVAWTKLYGFPWDPRLWLAFLVHDWGYWGKPNMDGPEGNLHILAGARLMGRLFGPDWYELCAYHSRFWAKQSRMPCSRLCAADKLAVALEPWWLYLPRARASGEIREYKDLARSRVAAGKGQGKYVSMNVYSDDDRVWFASVTDYLRRWAWEHYDGRDDTWTPEMPV